MLVILIGLGGCTLLFVGGAASVSNEIASPSISPTVKLSPQPKTPIKKVSPKIVSSKKDVVSPKKDVVNEELDIQVKAYMLSECYKETAEITFDRKLNIIKMIPQDPDFLLAVIGASEGDNTCLKAWNNFKKVNIPISKGFGDTTLSVINSSNTSRELLRLKNGKILYDVVEDK